jgi:hypothetical protein
LHGWWWHSETWTTVATVNLDNNIEFSKTFQCLYWHVTLTCIFKWGAKVMNQKST